MPRFSRKFSAAQQAERDEVIAEIKEASLCLQREDGREKQVLGEFTESMRRNPKGLEAGVREFMMRAFAAFDVETPRFSIPPIHTIDDHRGYPETWALALKDGWGAAYKTLQDRIKQATQAQQQGR